MAMRMFMMMSMGVAVVVMMVMIVAIMIMVVVMRVFVPVGMAVTGAENPDAVLFASATASTAHTSYFKVRLLPGPLP